MRKTPMGNSPRVFIAELYKRMGPKTCDSVYLYTHTHSPKGLTKSLSNKTRFTSLLVFVFEKTFVLTSCAFKINMPIVNEV